MRYLVDLGSGIWGWKNTVYNFYLPYYFSWFPMAVDCTLRTLPLSHPLAKVPRPFYINFFTRGAWTSYRLWGSPPVLTLISGSKYITAFELICTYIYSVP
jgi:hypothetical protein